MRHSGAWRPSRASSRATRDCTRSTSIPRTSSCAAARWRCACAAAGGAGCRRSRRERAARAGCTRATSGNSTGREASLDLALLRPHAAREARRPRRAPGRDLPGERAAHDLAARGLARQPRRGRARSRRGIAPGRDGRGLRGRDREHRGRPDGGLRARRAPGGARAAAAPERGHQGAARLPPRARRGAGAAQGARGRAGRRGGAGGCGAQRDRRGARAAAGQRAGLLAARTIPSTCTSSAWRCGVCARRCACSARCSTRGVRDAGARELRWLAALTSPARDWDVLATQTLPALLVRTAKRAPRARHARARRAAQGGARELHEALDTPRYARLVLVLARWLADRAPVAGARRG